MSTNVRYIDHMSPFILNAKQLGTALRAERRALGLTQTEIAVKMDSRRQTVADLEAGKNVSVYILIAALAAMGKGLTIVDARPSIDEIHSLLGPSDED
jgi:transcriptional regulator with XRE-family HTH domain